jgi:hypothetical protein
MQCAPTTRNVREVSQGYQGGDIFLARKTQLSRSVERRRADDGAFQQNSPEPLALTLFKWRRHWPSAILASVALGLATPAQAASPTMATWDGSANSNWNSSANWTPKGPPTDTATFPAVSNQVVRFPLVYHDYWPASIHRARLHAEHHLR